jgi:hypothetical protein
MSLTRVLLATLSFGIGTAVVAAQAHAEESPEWRAKGYVASANWGALEALIGELVESSARSDDGRFELYMVTSGIAERVSQNWGAERDQHFRDKFASYQREFPDSAFAPILDAIFVNATAWRARGHGYSPNVAPEGWALFRERTQAAWKMMLACKPHSASLPTWYEQAVGIAQDADVPAHEVTKLFNEGVQRFPGYHPIYFRYIRQFSPRWGGDYKDADAFIRAQVAARTNPEGEVLYTRLYWMLDQYDNGEPRFFEESRVSWPRMRAGFELLMEQFPKSVWNQANLVAYACRAGDAGTYYKWRRTVDLDSFAGAAPEGISLEVCDARFMKKI